MIKDLARLVLNKIIKLDNIVDPDTRAQVENELNKTE